MKIQLFKNGKGLIYGKHPKRIGCHTDGVLVIGSEKISLAAGKEDTLPMLARGSTGSYAATFTDKEGRVYDLGKVEVHSGLITAPPSHAVEIMELRCRLELAESDMAEMAKKIDYLEHMFDTDALKFLIG